MFGKSVKGKHFSDNLPADLASRLCSCTYVYIIYRYRHACAVTRILTNFKLATLTQTHQTAKINSSPNFPAIIMVYETVCLLKESLNEGYHSLIDSHAWYYILRGDQDSVLRFNVATCKIQLTVTHTLAYTEILTCRWIYTLPPWKV